VEPYGSLRTDGAGTLRAADAGREVVLGGWVAARRDHGGVAFFDLRDASGVVQVVADVGEPGAESSGQALTAAHELRSEWVVRVTGTVRASRSCAARRTWARRCAASARAPR